MKMQTMPRRQRLALDGLTVDSFPTMPELEIPNMAGVTISNCTRCPSHVDSLCPCCTGPYLCP
jgi:hypothetical protein